MNRMGNAIEHNTPPKLVSYRPTGRSNPSALEISLDPRRTDTIIFLLFGFINQQSAISSQHIQASLKTLKTQIATSKYGKPYDGYFGAMSGTKLSRWHDGNATCQSGRQSWIKASRPQRKRDRGWQECSSVAVERDTAKRHFVRCSRVEAKAS